ncbi:hypothetical protein [Pseudomonas serbica]|uniref:hypothetical protein n=1 Tax=Pseudomonas serbica TaxID=2965074 RepID=UPI00237A79B7|nr:hypothetical protein [Pseudomonas serbica]
MIALLTGMGLMALSVVMGYLLLTDNHQGPAKPLVDEYTILLLIAIAIICGWRGSSEILTLAGLNLEWRYYSPSLFVLGCGWGLWHSLRSRPTKLPARGSNHSQPACCRQEVE